MTNFQLAHWLWANYLNLHFPREGEEGQPEIEWLKPEPLLRLIWRFLEPVRSRAAFLNFASQQDAFDEEADSALVALATAGNMSAWDNASAGCWATLISRLTWAVAALQIEDLKDSPFKIAVPRDAPEDVRATAALLYLLGGPARSPPTEWRPAQPLEGLAAVMQAPLRKQ